MYSFYMKHIRRIWYKRLHSYQTHTRPFIFCLVYHNRNRQRYIRCPWEDISYLWKYLLNGYKQRGSNFIKRSLHPPPSKADIICRERNNIKVGLPYTWEVLWYQLLWEYVHCNLSSISLTLPGANRHRCFHHQLSGESELGPWPHKHRLSGEIIVSWWLEPKPEAFIAFGSWILPGLIPQGVAPSGPKSASPPQEMKFLEIG